MHKVGRKRKKGYEKRIKRRGMKIR